MILYGLNDEGEDYMLWFLCSPKCLGKLKASISGVKTCQEDEVVIGAVCNVCHRTIKEPKQ